MLRTFLSALVALSLTACSTFSTGQLPTPSSVADRTKLDEQAGITVTLAYTAASKAAALAIRLGVVTGAATIKRIGELDSRAFAAVMALRAAYQSGNSASYASGLTGVNAAIADLLAALKGPSASASPPPQTAPAFQAVAFGITQHRLHAMRVLAAYEVN